jgi:hypothetical protein
VINKPTEAIQCTRVELLLGEHALGVAQKKCNTFPKAEHKIYKLKAFNLLSPDEK